MELLGGGVVHVCSPGSVGLADHCIGASDVHFSLR